MTSKSIHLFIREMSSKPLDKNGISNRLKLLVDEGFLTRQSLDVSVTRARFLRYYYMLGIKGFHVLIYSDFFSDDKESLAIYQNSRDSAIPSIHTDAMSILANQIFLLCQKSIDLESFEHLRGADAFIPTRCGEKQRFVKESKIIPDWIFKSRKQFICIEMDTGSQNLQMITEKVQYYNKLYQKSFHKESGYALILIFAVLDDSIDVVKSFKKENRSKRVASLKSHIAILNLEFSEIYVVSAKRAHQLVESFISFEQPTINEDEKKDECSVLIQKTLSQSARYSISEKSLPTFINNFQMQQMPLTILEIKLGRKVQSILLIMGREGHVHTWKRLNITMEFAKEWKHHFQNNNDLIVMTCYENEEAAFYDVIGLELHAKLYKTSLQGWEAARDKNLHMPRMVQMLGPFSQAESK